MFLNSIKEQSLKMVKFEKHCLIKEVADDLVDFL